jgi:hypothetical protein
MHAVLRNLFCISFVITVGGCSPDVPDLPDPNTLHIFHNGTGPMCIDALDWLVEMQAERPDLVVEEHLTTDLGSLILLAELKSQYGQSQGVSTTFGYLPLIFFGGQAFSGFNDEIQQSLEGLIDAADAPSP